MSNLGDLLLAIDKPQEWTSFDAVAFLRGRLHVKRVGHSGTLDPFATGLLIIGINGATKQLDHWLTSDKTYLGTVRFGLATDTDDRTGNTIATGHVTALSELEEILPQFIGEQQQLPPQYSAIKTNGKPAYATARAGKETVLAPRSIMISELTMLEWNAPDAVIRVRCSKGTYIRALARDLGKALNTAATLQELRREAVGNVSVDIAVSPEEAVTALKNGSSDLPFVVSMNKEMVAA